MTRIESLTRLTEIAEVLNADELEVLTVFARKIKNGGAKHGPMNLDTDTRNWRAEIRDELMDAACYEVMGQIQAGRRQALTPKSPDPIVAGLRELRDATPERWEP